MSERSFICVSRQKGMTSFTSPALDGAIRRKQSNMFVPSTSKVTKRKFVDFGAKGIRNKDEIKRKIISPGILSPKVGQPATNCKRRFFNDFWARDVSSITYQKSLRFRVGGS